MLLERKKNAQSSHSGSFGSSSAESLAFISEVNHFVNSQEQKDGVYDTCEIVMSIRYKNKLLPVFKSDFQKNLKAFVQQTYKNFQLLCLG